MIIDGVYYRACSCGCKQPLRKKDGTPKIDAGRWAGKDCLNLDKRNRTASKRAKAKHPGPKLLIDGVEYEFSDMGAIAKALQTMGHNAKIIREKRAKKVKAS